jgi:hypothetical protein
VVKQKDYKNQQQQQQQHQQKQKKKCSLTQTVLSGRTME